MCWNCNQQDLLPPGIEGNFNMVKDRFSDTVHVRELDDENYPYADLFRLLVGMDYDGWILLEGREIPSDPIPAIQKQAELFEKLRG